MGMLGGGAGTRLATLLQELVVPARARRPGQQCLAERVASARPPRHRPLRAGLGGGFGAPAAPANPEVAYATQLQQLQDMGFFDRESNVRALVATGGNVHAAVERLLAS